MSFPKTIPPKKRKKIRLYSLLGMLAFLALAVFLVLKAFEKNLLFFVTPSDLAAEAYDEDARFRLGGLVEKGSVIREPDSLFVRFRVTDGGAAIPVEYEGLLPDLFREGQGVVVEGTIAGTGTFQANEVLAKHDENYMPPEVAEALKKSGRWQGEDNGGS